MCLRWGNMDARGFRVYSRRLLGAGVTAAILAIGLVVAGPTSAALADTAPASGTPSTVSADALPTWQVNGVVWQQAVVGNTVYAVGSFTKARPPGVGVGGAGEIDAANIFAYDLTTGDRVASFSHQLNGQALAVTASPDGKKLYIGGDFTTVDGVSRTHIAAFNLTTGALDNSFLVSVSTQTRALVATSSTVYIGGNYGKVNGQPRGDLAAVDATTGAILPWAPTAEGDNGFVWSMALAPSGRNLVVGGSFTSLSGVAASGMGSIDATTGEILPWAANQKILMGGKDSSIISLKTDGNLIYGSGYAFGTGNFEGTFAANPDTGEIVLVNDCHGDTYDVLPLGQVLYSVSHAHDCTWIGGFPDTNPRVRWQQAIAQTTYATGTNTGPDSYGWNYAGLPSSSLLQWYPDFAFGSYTSAKQAGWSITGNSDYIAVGGEFPKVNGTAQQGLVRFARAGLSPNGVGPSYGTIPARDIPATTALSLQPGTVRLTFGTAWDKDNEELTYDVLRDNTTWVYSTKIKTNYWTVPTAGFVDTGLAAGSTHYYTVRIRDSFGNTQWSPKSNTVTVAGDGALGGYAKDVLTDGANHYWRLGEASGAAAYDYASLDDLNLTGTYTRGAAGAITGDTDPATTFSGTTTSGATPTAVTAPSMFTEEAWVNTTSTAGGKIVGFGNKATGSSSSYDRHLYMATNGRVSFGVSNNGTKYTVTSAAALNDGQWHHLVGSFDGSGMTLYVDGVRVGRSAATTTATSYTGYWRVGGDATWSGAAYLKGAIDDVAIYPAALTPTQVLKHYADSGRTLPSRTTPADSYGSAVTGSDPDLFWRLGEASGTTATDTWRYGLDGTYVSGVTLGGASAVTGTTDTSATFNGTTGLVASKSTFNNPTSYSEELWFKTTTTRGGKLIGFGSSSSGLSSSYDRHVYMLNNGVLRFGAGTGTTQAIIESAKSYNDGVWHHVVATQGVSGMTFYVDGLLVGSNAQSTPQNYVGYWRVGGDRNWTGPSSNYFAGSIDEVSIYSRPLTPAEIVAHFKAGGGELPNQPPSAAFAATTRYLAASFDSTSSSDPEGKPLTYAWTFGDGATSTDANPAHTYATAGTYPVRLTVTDVKGATSTVTNNVTVVANQPPTAAFTSGATYLAASFDATMSSDPEAGPLAYSWSYGDGSASGSGATATHTYATSGTYTVTLTVTDAEGATATTSHDVTVAEKPNDPPTAAFSSSAHYLVASFDGTGSADPEGGSLTYAWDFGDGGSSSEAKPSHTYNRAGTFTAILTVTDPKGASGSVSHDVTVVANGSPRAAFTSSVSDLAATFDGSTSSDPEGGDLTYAWDFGDGGTSGAAKPAHTYGSSGTYQVALTVTDPEGATDVVTHDVTVTEPPNQPPTAAFTSSATQLAVSFDGSGSADPEGGALTYAWDFGDHSDAGTGAKPAHTYSASGTYSVTLTVTDPKGASTNVSHTVTVTSVVTLASDDFSRSVTGGWGSADLGGAWTVSPAARTSVGSGVGNLVSTAAGNTTSAYLQSVSSTDADVQTQLQLSAVPVGGTNGVYLSVIPRRVVGSGDYRAKIRVQPTGAVRISLARTAADGTEASIAAEVTAAGLTYQTGDTLDVRVQATGTSPTTVRAKVWKHGTSEPSTWQVSATDSTGPLQAVGGVGLVAYVSGTVTNLPLTVAFDAFRVVKASTL